MPVIRIRNLANREIKYTNERQSLLQVFQESGQDWMHACGGKGRCTTCGFDVFEGMDQLSGPTHVETNFRSEGRLGASQRLACQTRCAGEVDISVPRANKLPHLSYGES